MAIRKRSSGPRGRLQVSIGLVTVASLIAASLSWPGPTVATATPHPEAQSVPVTTVPPAQTGTSWSVVPTPNVAGGRDQDQLDGVSCVSSSFCMAVGYEAKAATSAVGGAVAIALFERWNGETWSVVSPGVDEGEMNGVSCTSPQFCMAVGTNAGSEAPIDVWNGLSWRPLHSGEPEGSQSLDLHGVSCTSPTSCVAVGGAVIQPPGETFAGEDLAGINEIETWNGSNWFTVTSPNPGSFSNGMWDVSCTAVGGSMCVAVGGYENSASAANHNNGDGHEHAFIEVEHRGNWSIAQVVDKVAANSSRFYGVSCTATNQCVVVGFYDDVAENYTFLLDDNWNGQAWATQRTPPTVPAGTGVSCLSPTNCTEVGPTGRVAAWDGQSWSPVSTPARAPGVTKTVTGISCAPGLCVAVGQYVEQGFEYTYAEQGCSGLVGGTGNSNVATASGALTRLAAAATSNGSAPALEQSAVTSPNPDCNLDITITPLEHLPVRVGLAVHPQPYAPSQYPVDFVTGTSNGERCESGCVDLLVTVTDPRTHKGVKDAVLNASVSPITDVDVVTGKQELCATNEQGALNLACGSYLLGERSNIETDNEGHVYLRYWAPGVIVPTSTLLRVTARVKCSPSVCPSHEQTGTQDETLPVTQYLIYSHSGGLSEAEVDDLIEWSKGGNAFTKFLEKSNISLTTLNIAVHAVKAAEILEEKVVESLELVERAEPVAYVVDAINILTALGERAAMVDEFLYAADLDAQGLGADPSEGVSILRPSTQFSELLVNFGVAAPFHYGVAGAWWDLANDLRVIAGDNGSLYVNGKSIPFDKIDFSDFGVKLNVWEVSTCDESKGFCEPGYANDVGTAVVLRAGIQPALCFKLVLTYNGYQARDYYFVSPYDAIAWTQTESNLKGLLKAS